MIQGLMGRANGDLDSIFVARLMLIVNTSALHTTTVVLTTALYELAARPDLGEMLREEFLQNVGDCNGNENAAAITTDLPMLDSFLKEVVRMTPPGHCTFLAFICHPPLFAHCFGLQLRLSARCSKILRFPAGCIYRPESRSRSLHMPHIEIQDCIMTQTRSTRCASTISARKTSALAPALSIPRFQTMYFLTEFTPGAYSQPLFIRRKLSLGTVPDAGSRARV